MKNESIDISSELLEEFKAKCKPYLEDIDYIIYSNINDSSISKEVDEGNIRCSVLTVGIKTEFKYNSLQIDPIYGNWNDTFQYSTEVKKIWNNMLRKNGYLNDINTPIEYLFFECSEIIQNQNIVYSSKKEVIKYIVKLKLPKPVYIFACSDPGYKIVLKNNKEYMKYYDFGISKLRDKIIDVLIMNGKKLDYGSISLEILHKKMPNIDIFGLSRED